MFSTSGGNFVVSREGSVPQRWSRWLSCGSYRRRGKKTTQITRSNRVRREWFNVNSSYGIHSWRNGRYRAMGFQIGEMTRNQRWIAIASPEIKKHDYMQGGDVYVTITVSSEARFMFSKLLEYKTVSLCDVWTVKVRGITIMLWWLHPHEISSVQRTLSECLQVHRICTQAMVWLNHQVHNMELYIPYRITYVEC